jgi:anti-sigma factor RsiW
MNMEVTRNVILDLLPLYLAGEASADTAALVENYLETNPDLAKMVQQTDKTGLSDVPVPLSKDDAMEAYVKANQRMITRTLLLGAIIVVVIVGTIALVMAIIYGGFK